MGIENEKRRNVWAIEPPKMEDANCNQNSRERPDESRPPRYRYSLRLATMAAAEKQPNTKAQPTNAPTRMLKQEEIVSKGN
nr:40S ribosomal protein S14 [Ipomoea batatas]GMC80922.1 40S ribosomal protein S14 [Ipomoea batatas]GMC85253.1 40S ribosomal protein S14 [Ipomoea batatas]